MTKFVGRLGTLGVAVEATRGTPVNPTFWVPWVTMSFKDTVTEAREEQAHGKIADSDSKYVTMKMGDGEIEAELYDVAMGAFMTALMGTSPVSTGSNPYTHTYTLSNTNTHDSLSLYFEDPDRNDLYPLAMLESFNITAEPTGKVQYTAGFRSKTAREWTSQTPDFTSLGNKFLHQHVQIKLASNLAGIAAASVISVKNLDVTFSKNTAYDNVMGTVEPEDILNQQLAVEGSLTLNLQDDTYRDLMLNGTYRALEIKLNRSSSSSLAFQFPRVDFSEWEPDYSLNEIVTQTINFKANYDAANADDIIDSCVLINANTGASY